MGIGGGLLYLAFQGIELDKLIAEVRDANLYWLLLAIGVGLVSHFFRAARWRMQLIASGYGPSTLNTYAAVMVAYLVNLALPRAGEVARCSVLFTSDKVPVSTSLGTVVVERVFDVIVLGLLAAIVFFFEYDTIYQGLVTFSSGRETGGEGIPGWIYWVAGSMLVITAIVFLFRKQILQVSFFRKAYDKGLTFINALIQGALSIRYMKRPGLFVFYTLAIWLCYILMTYVGFFSMESVSGSEINLPYFALIITVVGGIGFALPSPGGIGAYHAAVVITFLGFQLLPEQGATRELGMAFATILHTSQLLMMVIVGGVAYLYLWLKPPVDSTLPTGSGSLSPASE